MSQPTPPAEPHPLELAEQRSLGDVCEAGGVFLHELGNALNVLLFEVALLERKPPEQMRAGLGVLRDLGRGIAQQMQELRRYEDGLRPRPYAVDVNAAVQAAADAVGRATGVPLALELEPGLPLVQATLSDLHRLVRLLTGVAARMPEAVPPVRVQTRRAAERVQLRVQWAGPEGAGPPALPETEEVRFAWAICQRVLRRLRGTLQTESQAGGGGAFCAEVLVAPQ
jgi:hypothetical protein